MMYNNEHIQKSEGGDRLNRGRFLTLEGIDGSGKTTQIAHIAEILRASGEEAMLLREPGGTLISEEIRGVLLNKQNTAMSVETELLLFAAARAQLVREVIEPALARGVWVVCDRFMDSTTAYQGYGRQIDLDLINQLNSIAVGGCIPDITILFDLSVDHAAARLAGRSGKTDRLDLESRAFAQRTRLGYLEIAALEPERFRIVDAEMTEDQIAQQIKSIIREGTSL
ncbi:MAG: dTMP kinase [Clostridiales bacterium]|jgi:dTMP kinase|nr:dTMP kinase [Clostridiales bacterium]